MFINPTLSYMAAGVLAVVFLLFVLSRRFPRVGWLQHFRFDRPYDPERDRKLDTSWITTPGIRPKRNPFQAALGDLREDVRAFGASFPQLPKEQRARQRRRSNVYAGVQLILLGIVLPFGYHLLSMMLFFSEVSRAENALVLAASGLCIVLGIVALWRSGKD